MRESVFMGERDRERQNAAWRKWYRENASRKIGWQRRRREELRKWWNDLKATMQCARCGESAPECLQFHHRDPRTKTIEVSIAVGRRCWSRERILAEMAKCDVLCANCHAKHHWDEALLRSK